MPTGMSGLFRNTYGARAERGHDTKRLERAIGIFQKTRKIYKGDTTVYMIMNTNDVAEILGWLEELKEYRATSSPSGTERNELNNEVNNGNDR